MADSPRHVVSLGLLSVGSRFIATSCACHVEDEDEYEKEQEEEEEEEEKQEEEEKPGLHTILRFTPRCLR
jgi:hypothetical protein